MEQQQKQGSAMVEGDGAGDLSPRGRRSAARSQESGGATRRLFFPNEQDRDGCVPRVCEIRSAPVRKEGNEAYLGPCSKKSLSGPNSLVLLKILIFKWLANNNNSTNQKFKIAGYVFYSGIFQMLRKL
jgi:hypothetical protein